MRNNQGYQVNRFDAEGNRNNVLYNGREQNKLYLGQQVLSELNNKGQEKAFYSRGTTLLETDQNVKGTGYYLSTSRGDILSVLDESGQTLNSYTYDAFGKTLNQVEELYNPYKYAGYEQDRLKTDYYLNARTYRPDIGRFLQEDNYRGDGLNLYAYVANNPLIYVDPSGYCKQDSNKGMTQDEIAMYLIVCGPSESPFLNGMTLEPYTEEIITYNEVGYDVEVVVNQERLDDILLRYPEEMHDLYWQGQKWGTVADTMMPVLAGIGDYAKNRSTPQLPTKPQADYKDIYKEIGYSNETNNGVKNIFGTDSSSTMTSTELRDYAKSQEWSKIQTDNEPEKWVDENGIARVTIKKGSTRAPGSSNLHVEIKDVTGQRIDQFGNPVTRKSLGNHTPIIID